jgi:predicted cupin superfamily sugar epimerase
VILTVCFYSIALRTYLCYEHERKYKKDMDAQDVIRVFQLQPHPREDGFFRETYRSDDFVSQKLPRRYKSGRCFSTAILFLIAKGKFSAFHRLQSEEIFHFHAGGPAELIILAEDGALEVHTLGADLAAGHQVQVVVPRNTWQALRLTADASWVLVGCTVSPGFEYDDFEDADRNEMLRAFPQHAALINELVKPAAV